MPRSGVRLSGHRSSVRRGRRVLRQNVVAGAVGADRLAFVAEIEKDQRVAKGAAPPVASDHTRLNENGFFRTHDVNTFGLR